MLEQFTNDFCKLRVILNCQNLLVKVSAFLRHDSCLGYLGQHALFLFVVSPKVVKTSTVVSLLRVVKNFEQLLEQQQQQQQNLAGNISWTEF
jgi:hypothetical protein